MTEDKITEISCIADDYCKVFLLGVKEVKLGVKEVREVKEVKAVCFANHRRSSVPLDNTEQVSQL